MRQGNKMISICYNSPIKTGEKMKIKVRMSNELGFANDLKAMFNRHGENPGQETRCYLTYNEKISTDKSSVFEGEIVFNSPGYRTFYIDFKLNGLNKKIEFDEEKEEPAITEKEELNYFEQFVYFNSFKTPDWIKGGIMYQIYVDTFCAEDIPEHLKEKVVSWHTYPKWKPDEDGVYRNNQWYGGNLKGIIKKLPYIKSLGVTVIYLTPILKSPSSNRYDIENYEQIDELVGTWEDKHRLKVEAKKLGIDLIDDEVFNHSSNKNWLLNEHPDMYEWEEPYAIPKCWWGYKHLVEFNKTSNKYEKYLTTLIPNHLKYTSGIRMDVADNMPDFSLKGIYKIVKEFSNESLVLLEVWKNAITGDFREFLYGDEADGVMNYRFGNAILRYVRWANAKDFKEIIGGICRLYPPEALDASPIFLSSHDTPRIPNTLVGDFMKESRLFENIFDIDKDEYWFDGEIFNTLRFRSWEAQHDSISEENKELAYNLHMLAVFFQYTFPGLPSIFAGDEAGVTGNKDPFNRKPFPWDNIDKKLYNFYVRIGKFRIQHRSIFANSKNFKIMNLDNRKIVYKRDKLVFIANMTSKDIQIKKYNLKKTVFSLKGVKKEHILPAYNAVALYVH